MSTHLVIPDTHAHANHNNDRADWLAKLITDINPDVVIHLGDSADLPSLSGYDKGKRGFIGRTYRADIDAHLDFQTRLWEPIWRRKKKLPRRVFIIGNHEQRIDRALDLSPELVGTIGYKDLALEDWYDTVVPYSGNTPGVIKVDGISYAHYFVSGSMGKPISSQHPGHAIVAKRHISSTCGHSHLLNHYVGNDGDGKRIHGLVAGVYQDFDSEWAGDVNKLWWRGVVVKRNVEDGDYNPQFISIEALKREYSNVR
jgi:3',5'-cyclic AMP phosphodiesterase CpdA